MTKKSFQIYYCDRCGAEETVGEAYYDTQKLWSWGRIWLRENNGPKSVGVESQKSLSTDYAKDLCPQCLSDMYNLYHNRSKDNDK